MWVFGGCVRFISGVNFWKVEEVLVDFSDVCKEFIKWENKFEEIENLTLGYLK